MKTKLFCLFFFVLLKSYAQQEPHFTLYWNNYSAYNPAATGIFSNHYAALNGRLQWLGLPGGPKDINVVYDFKINQINSGIGINFLRDQIGDATTNKANLNYAYHIKIGENRIISTGAAISYIHKNVQFLTISPDPSLRDISGNFIDFNVGAMYKSKRVLLGFSTTQLSESSNMYIRNSRHYFLNFAYEIPLNDNFYLKPGFLFKRTQIYYDGTFNVLAYYKKKYWAGLNYNIDFSFNSRVNYFNTDFIGPMFGVDIAEKIRVGYTFDYHLTYYSKPNNTSHEIVIAWIIN